MNNDRQRRVRHFEKNGEKQKFVSYRNNDAPAAAAAILWTSRHGYPAEFQCFVVNKLYFREDRGGKAVLKSTISLN